MLKTLVRRTEDVNATARVRVANAIKQRLDALGMTGREFGKQFSANAGKGHGDQWVSNLLNHRHALSLKELDEAARILKCTPAQLVKTDFETADYLTPTEYRIVEAVRGLPAAIRDHFLLLAEYLIGVAPEEIDHLQEFRELSRDNQARVRHWTHALRLSKEPVPGLPILLDPQETGAEPTAAGRHTPRGRRRRK